MKKGDRDYIQILSNANGKDSSTFPLSWLRNPLPSIIRVYIQFLILMTNATFLKTYSSFEFLRSLWDFTNIWQDDLSIWNHRWMNPLKRRWVIISAQFAKRIIVKIGWEQLIFLWLSRHVLDWCQRNTTATVDGLFERQYGSGLKPLSCCCWLFVSRGL